VLPEDVYALRWASDPRLSPDGRTVAVVENWVDREANDYRAAIWLVPVDGSSPGRRITAGHKVDVDPRFSPEGSRLAFASSRDGEKKQLYVLPLDGGDALRLTELGEDVTDAVWSPDGSRLAFVARVRAPEYAETDDRRRSPRRFKRLSYKLDNVGWIGDRRRHVFVVPADGSEPARQLTDGDFEDGPPSWSPDGTRLVFAAGRHEDWDVEPFVDLYVVPASGGEPRPLTRTDAEYEAPAWSPDGVSIACRVGPGGFDYPHHQQIAVVDATTGERRVLTGSLDRNCGPYPALREPIWEADSIVFGLEDAGNTHVYRVSRDGSGAPGLVVGGEQRVTGYDVAGGVLVHTASTATVPAELYAGERRLTDFSRDFCRHVSLVAPERFTATSPDGAEVDAWIVRPPGFEAGRRYPTILTIHGGPFSQYGTGFFDEVQVYARAGHVVLFSNPRGSSGYREAWGRAIRGPVDGGGGWGSVDYVDLMAVVDTALARFDCCDAGRLAVMGGSYGGYMTSWIIGHTDRFRAAISERAVNNMISEFGSSDIGWFMKGYTGVFPFEDLEPFVAQSPTTYATRITTPVLLLHSEQDLRCNVEQAEHLFTILRLLKRDVEFVRFPAESHELTRSGSPLHRVQRFELVLEWFARKL